MRVEGVGGVGGCMEGYRRDVELARGVEDADCDFAAAAKKEGGQLCIDCECAGMGEGTGLLLGAS